MQNNITMWLGQTFFENYLECSVRDICRNLSTVREENKYK